VEMICQAAVKKMEQHDFFSSLPNANDNDSDLETLSKDEIISMLLILHFLIMLTVPGNIYIFLVEVRNRTSFRIFFLIRK
jgi:hypothetical protein